MTNLLLLALASATPQPGDLRTFRDWTVGCDNVRTCHATSLLPEGGDWDHVAALSVRRGGEAGAFPMIAIFPQEGKAASLRVDGQPLPLRLVAMEEESRIDKRDTAAAVAALRSGTTLEVRDQAGKPLGTVSLAGASAALLYMDDAQKRVGTVTALARSGPLPASAVPMPAQLPIVVSAAVAGPNDVRVEEQKIAELRRTSDCVPESPDFPGYDSDQEPLDGAHTLLLLGCGAGAYNYSSVPYIASRHGGDIIVEAARFDAPPRWAEEGKVMLVNANWDPKSGLLSSFAKGRGIGDCGIGSDYAWDGERFRLVEQIEMGECRGSTDYITTWRARVVKR